MTALSTQTREIRFAFQAERDRVLVQPVPGLEKVAKRQGWRVEREESTGICIVIKGCKPNA